MTAVYVPSRLRPALWFAGLLLGIIVTERLVTGPAQFAQHPLLPVAVALDLLVVLPLLFYFLVVRRYGLPLSTLLGALGGGLALVHWLVPAAQQLPLRGLRFLPALLEAGTLAVLAAKARTLVQHYRAAHRHERRFWPSARRAVQQALGPAGVLLVAELDMLRYALLGWGAAPEVPAGAVGFSAHRESGFTAVAMVLGLALAAEAGAVHLLASLWSARLAGWLLFFDGYALVLLVAHCQAVRLRPTLLVGDALHLRVGFVWQLVVPLAEVVATEPLRDSPAPAPGLRNLSKLLFAPANLLLTFAQPVTVQGPYGLRRTARRLAVYLDQPQQFRAALGR